MKIETAILLILQVVKMHGSQNGPLHLTVLKSTANDLSLIRNKQDICWKIDFLNSLIKDNF